MFKKITILLFCLIIITGCNNKVEEEKNVYLETKSILETTDKFTLNDDLPCDITISLDRTDEEKVKYKAVLNNPKYNMNNVKILVIHNQYTEDVFPSIGLIDDNVKNLKIGDNNEIDIEGVLNTTDDIDNLSLEFRIWLEYTNDNNEKNTIYYKTTI